MNNNKLKKIKCKKEFQVKKLKLHQKKEKFLNNKHKLKEINMNHNIQVDLKKFILLKNHMKIIYNMLKKYMKNGLVQVIIYYIKL